MSSADYSVRAQLMAHQHQFFLPEAHLSVKVLFDNVRNYAICGAFLAFAILLDRGTLGAPRFAEGPYWELLVRSMPAISTILAITLFLLNVVQSVLILFRTVDAFGEFTSKPADWLTDERRSSWLSVPAMFAFLLVPCFLFIFFGAAILVILYLMVLATAGLHVL